MGKWGENGWNNMKQPYCLIGVPPLHLQVLEGSPSRSDQTKIMKKRIETSICCFEVPNFPEKLDGS